MAAPNLCPTGYAAVSWSGARSSSTMTHCRMDVHGRRWIRSLWVSAALLLTQASGSTLVAQTNSLVPLQGQTAQQVSADQQQCAQQAASQTGYNPAAAPAPASKPAAGQRVAGAARGAAAGKVVSNTTKETETD